MLRIFIFLIIISPLLSNAQGGIIARQLFKPGLKLGGEAMYEGLFEGEQVLGFYSAKAGVVVPIKSKYKLKIQPKELLNLKNLWELRKFKDWETYPKIAGKLIQPKAYQVFWNFNAQYTVMYGKDYYPAADVESESTDQISGLMKVSTGVTGMYYMQKMRAIFYSADVGFMEDERSISKLRPVFNLMAGQAKIQNPFTYYYYGLYLNVSNGRTVPIPFVGVDLRVANKMRLNLTLPFQAKMSFKINKKKRYALLVQYNGFTSGFTPDTPDKELVKPRYNFTHTYAKATGILEQKLSKNLKVFTEIGWAGVRRFREYDRAGGSVNKTIKLKSSPYAYISIYHTFGKSLFDSSIGNLLNL